jgi:hypothetical protein
MKDDALPLSTRRGIAKDAAPYLLARLAVVATGNAMILRIGFYEFCKLRSRWSKIARR